MALVTKPLKDGDGEEFEGVFFETAGGDLVPVTLIAAGDGESVFDLGAAIGALDDAAVVDHEAASASMLGLLRGILAALNTIATNTTPDPG